MISKIEIESRYNVTLQNDADKEESILSIDNFALTFTSKDQVSEHIEILTRALEFWEFDR